MRDLPDAMPLPVAVANPVYDPADYRKALSCFATGVTVVSTHWQGEDWGMTCNSFSSVSLEPRLVLWSIRKAASSLDAFVQSGGFVVSVLSQAQKPLVRQFSQGDMASRFANVPIQRGLAQRPRLVGSLAWFDCQLHQLVDAGDHHIVIGEAVAFGCCDAEALVFWRSQLGRFESSPTAS